MATWFHLPVGWKVHEGPGLGGRGPPRSSDQTCGHSNRLECWNLYYSARDGLSAAAMQDIRFRSEAASSCTCSKAKTPVNWSLVWEPTTSCLKVSVTAPQLSFLQNISRLCGLNLIISTRSEEQAAEWHLGGGGEPLSHRNMAAPAAPNDATAPSRWPTPSADSAPHGSHRNGCTQVRLLGPSLTKHTR